MMVTPVSSKRHSAHDLITASATRARTLIDDTRVNRVLALLSDQTLAAAAADQTGTPGLLTIESVDVPLVWEDDRIAARVAELALEEIAVDTQLVEKTAAGMTFERWVIQVRY